MGFLPLTVDLPRWALLMLINGATTCNVRVDTICTPGIELVHRKPGGILVYMRTAGYTLDYVMLD